ncbi:hypothetical protein GGR54DRAFT_309056 [Hypoxylon sp. NC1633]|nr:hypothetical protein GGR54DRAFT_309056 [Hypoxylon sp. NC1633]
MYAQYEVVLNSSLAVIITLILHISLAYIDPSLGVFHFLGDSPNLKCLHVCRVLFVLTLGGIDFFNGSAPHSIKFALRRVLLSYKTYLVKYKHTNTASLYRCSSRSGL